MAASGDLDRNQLRRWIGVAVLVVGLVFATTVAVLQWRRAGRLEHTEQSRNAAAATASRFGVALFTYDYRDLATARARLLALATPNFAKSYDVTSAAEQAAATKLQAHETAKATGVFLTEVVGSRAAAVVVLATALQSSNGTRTAVSYLDVALVRQAGAWRVDFAKPVAVS